MAARPGEPAREEAGLYGPLAEGVRPHLAEWAACRSQTELARRASYRESVGAIEQLLTTVDTGDCTSPAGVGDTRTAPARATYRVVAWNLQRGIQLDGQIEALRTHPYLAAADVLLLNEADVGMARSGNRAVARALARELRMHYAFAPTYLNLAKGSGLEQHVSGENGVGLEGNAVLSRHPMREVQRVPLPRQADTVAHVDKRVGAEAALAVTIDAPGLPVRFVSVHFGARTSRRHRRAQMEAVLAHAAGGAARVVLGGDWNTTTTDASGRHSAGLIAWRSLLGIDHLIREHYLRPDRRFEKRLFALLERRGFDYRACNRLGEPTLSYDMNDLRASSALRDWVPAWCLAWIRWGLRNHGGRCPLRLDWFATRGVACRDPVVVHDAHGTYGARLSDHDPIGVEILGPCLDSSHSAQA